MIANLKIAEIILLLLIAMLIILLPTRKTDRDPLYSESHYREKLPLRALEKSKNKKDKE